MNEFEATRNTEPNVRFSDPYNRSEAPAAPEMPVQQAAPVNTVYAQTAPTNTAAAENTAYADPAPANTQAPESTVYAQQAPVQQAQPSVYGYAQAAQPETPVREQPFASPYAKSDYKPADFAPKQKKSGKRIGLSIAAICASLLIAGGSFYAGATYNATSAQQTAATTTAASGNSVAAANIVSPSSDGGEISSTITEVVEQAMPSMVAINTITQQSMNQYGTNPFFYYMFGDEYNQTYETQASGSGIIIAQNDTELLIATNNHVIEDADTISVQFIDEKSYNAEIKGTAAENDLAVIAVKLSDIDSDTISKIKVAALGSSDNLKLGEPAIAIGNSLGYGQSVTVGYISAVEREVQISDRTMKLIQTDAAINPGNSGGALLNIKGEVIGINSAKYSDTSVEGTGYAIPISTAEPIITELMNSGSVTKEEKPYLGIYGQDVPENYRDRFNWPEGVYVSRVTTGSPAALAGIEAGDIITSINGEKTTSMDTLQEILDKCAVGDKVKIEVTRTNRSGDLETVELTATLISRTDAGVE